MKKIIFAFAVTLTLITTLFANDDYWQQFVHYKMDVTLLPLEHAIYGDETIIYANNSPDTLFKFYLHLYPNAFKSNNTLRAQEYKKFYRKNIDKKEDAGYINIESFHILTDTNSNYDLNYKSLSAFEINETILEAGLPEPLAPGDTLTIKLSFYHKIRKFQGRAGYNGFQYDMAQWYPKVCVYDESGWNAEQFHAIGEFYGEFGTFDVKINTPFEYIIGATGVVVDGDPGWELVKVNPNLSRSQWPKEREKMQDNLRKQAAQGQMRSVTFHAENVHDFAWVACPDFLYESGDWEGIPIHVLYRSYAKDRWSKIVVERAKLALAWLSEKFGRYPYPQLTITHGLLSGGMEYPMLNMNHSESEGLILHEIGHIYFYGILGNNEIKEAWLDEGFTTFQTRWYMETRYGKWGLDRQNQLKQSNWLQKHRPALTERQTRRNLLLSLMNSGHDMPVVTEAYKFNEQFVYYENVYTKAAFFLDMLKYVVSDSAFENICKTYFDRWKFKHVTEARFKKVCEEVSGKDLTWLFKTWLHDTPEVDYALHEVKKSKPGDQWLTEVTVIKNGKTTMPVEVALTTKSGQASTKRWDGMANIGKVTFTTAEKPDKIELDPNDRILDNNRLNNGGEGLQFLFEYPNMAYLPRDDYLVTWRPGGWYNETDKFRVGGQFKLHNSLQKRAELGLWYGTESKELDARFGYTNPIKTLGSQTTGTVMAQKMEGRFEIDTHLSFLYSKYVRHEPQHRFWLGFNHTKLLADGENYTLRELDQKNDVKIQTWEKGDVNKLYFRYFSDPRGIDWFTNITVGLDIAHKNWGGDFTFNTLFTTLKFWAPNPREGVFFRLYGKKITNADNAPLQELVYLDGANPRERFKHFYLRSQGGLPAELHYHLPGDGNLRGYFNNPIPGNQVYALNFELRKLFNLRLLGRKVNRLLGESAIAVFWDMASLEQRNFDNEFYADAGLGLRITHLLPDNWYTIFTGGRNLTLRFDFPLWVNKPLPGEKELKFRWVFGFEQAF